MMSTPNLVTMTTSHLWEDHSLGQVKSEAKVPGESVREWLVELQDLDQVLHIDGVYITVGQSPYVHHRLTQASLFPVGVSTHVITTKEGQDLTILA